MPTDVQPLISDNQMRALEFYISKSLDATEGTKRALIWLLRQTNGLTRNVSASFSVQENGEEIAHNVHDMVSANGKTHLNTITALLGMDAWVVFCFHAGRYVKGESLKTATEQYYTVWITRNEYYDPTAEDVAVDSEAIGAVSLEWRDILGDDFYTSHRRDQL